MSWRWVPDREPTRSVPEARTFASQGEAESWLGEFYPELMSAGIRAVSLYEEERLVYGPMSLEADYN
jgi:hypothetical protein